MSRHLRVLNSSGVIAYQRRSTTLVYELVHDALNPLRQWLGEVEAHEAPVRRNRRA
jgi:hypothetical protein